MIVVKVEHWPDGDKSRAEMYGYAKIEPMVKDPIKHTVEYSVLIYGGRWDKFISENPWRMGKVLTHTKPINPGIWDIVYMALKKIVGYRSERGKRERTAQEKSLSDTIEELTREMEAKIGGKG